MTRGPEEIELGTVIAHIRESALPDDIGDHSVFIGLDDIEAHEGTLTSQSRTGDVRSRVFRFQSGDVLYGRLRPYLRKAVSVEIDGFASTETIVLRCSDRILPQFLVMVLLSSSFTQYVTERTKGDRPRTSFATLAGYELDLPPIEEQERILALESRLTSAVVQVRKASDTFRTAATAVLDGARSRLIWASASGQALGRFEHLVESINYGTSTKSAYDISGTPVLRIPNVGASGTLETGDLKYSALDEEESKRFRLRADDILIVRSNGSIALVGRAARVTEKEEGFAFAGYLLRLRPRAAIDSGFLLQMLRSIEFQRQVKAAAKSSTGINNLSAGRLAGFEVPIFPLEKQKEIGSTLADLERAVSTGSTQIQLTADLATTVRDVLRNALLGLDIGTKEVHPALERPHPRTIARDSKVGRQLKHDVERMLLEHLAEMPTQQAAFGALFDELKLDYDSVRESVFELLTSDPPRLVQVFDEGSASIALRRLR